MISTLAIGLMFFGAVQSTQSQTDAIKPASASPFGIARVVNKSSHVWKSSYVQIDVDLKQTWKTLGISAGDFEICPGDCEGKIFTAELTGKPGKEIILKLTKSYNFCRYLIFERINSSSGKVHWRLIGHIDHDFNRYQMASHRIVRAFGRNWFVLRGQEGSGSGYYLYGETWFEVGPDGIKAVLNYSADGYTDPGLGGLKWELKGQPLAFRRVHKTRVIRLGFEIQYAARGFGKSDFKMNFVVKRHADYVWDKESGEFVFDSHHSTISEREMNGVANIGDEPSEENGGTTIGQTSFFSGLKGFVGGGFEIFLRLNIKRLEKIAQGPNNSSKEWLREFLKECDDVPEKLPLEKSFANQLPQSIKQR